MGEHFLTVMLIALWVVVMYTVMVDLGHHLSTFSGLNIGESKVCEEGVPLSYYYAKSNILWRHPSIEIKLTTSW